MPELPDILAYIQALESRIVGQTLDHVRLASPFLLRSVEPPLSQAEGRTVRELRRVGKRIAIGLDGEPGKVEAQGRYEDVYVKTTQGWRFQSRVHVLAPGQAEVSRGSRPPAARK